MDYTKSVFIPEVALDKAADLRQSQQRTDLMGRVAGLDQGDASESVLVKMLRQLRAQQAQIANLSLQLEKAQLSSQINFAQK